MPEAWQSLGDRLLTSDSLFELERLPRRLAVVGLGAIGSELGQALAMLEVEVYAFGLDDRVAGLTNPEVNTAALTALGRSLPLEVWRPDLPLCGHGDEPLAGI